MGKAGSVLAAATAVCFVAGASAAAAPAGPAAEPGSAPVAMTPADVALITEVGRSIPLQVASLGSGTSAEFAASSARLMSYLTSASWTIPVAHYHLTARFDDAGGNWGGGHHTGLDFAGEEGEPVMAARSGVVVESGFAGAYGNSVVIRHGGGVLTRYAHMLTTPEVVVGQSVARGQEIGLRGSTGNSTGAHLHFEILRVPVAGEPQEKLVPLNPEVILPLTAEER